jgi:PAS domain S-box-containing protein
VQLGLRHRGGIGLSLLAASLFAIAVVIALVFKYQQMIAERHIAEEGVNLARLITKLPGTDEQRLTAWREFFVQQHRDEHFAYGSIVQSDQSPIVEVTTGGVVVPPGQLGAEQGWVKQISHESGFIEFFGPIEVSGSPAYFRIGYLQPSYWVELDQMPKVASLILPVFLLVPLFMFFWRREVTALRAVNEEMATMLSEDASRPPDDPGDIKEFANQFNDFIAQAKDQIAEYESAKAKLVTSEKFLNYRLHRFESVLQSLPDGLVIIDGEAVVSFANRAAQHILGVGHEELVGHKIGDSVKHPELDAYFAKGAQSIGQLLGESAEFKLEHHPDTTFSVTAYRLAGTGNANHHIIYMRDASSEARARRSRSEFVDTLGMYSEALQDDDGMSPEIQLEAANVINDEVERLARLRAAAGCRGDIRAPGYRRAARGSLT